MDYDLNLNLNHVENEIFKKYAKHVELLTEKGFALSLISFQQKQSKN